MEEAQEIQQLISVVVQSEGRDVDLHYNRYKNIVSTDSSSMLHGSTLSQHGA